MSCIDHFVRQFDPGLPYHWLEYHWEEVESWDDFTYGVEDYTGERGLMIQHGTTRIFVPESDWIDFQDMFPDRIPLEAWT